MVLAKDEETGEQAYKEVTHLYRNDKEIIYELTVGDQSSRRPTIIRSGWKVKVGY